jgi:hypothetical protein
MPLHVIEVPMTMQQACVCQAMMFNFVVVIIPSFNSWSLEVNLVSWILVVDLIIQLPRVFPMDYPHQLGHLGKANPCSWCAPQNQI